MGQETGTRLGEARNAPCHDFCRLEWLPHGIHLRTDEQLGIGRLVVRFPVHIEFALGKIGRQVMDSGGDLDAGHAVNRRMVNLGQDCDAALGQPLDIVEPFNDRELPERFVQIERARMEPCGQNAQLPPVTGRR